MPQNMPSRSRRSSWSAPRGDAPAAHGEPRAGLHAVHLVRERERVRRAPGGQCRARCSCRPRHLGPCCSDLPRPPVPCSWPRPRFWQGVDVAGERLFGASSSTSSLRLPGRPRGAGAHRGHTGLRRRSLRRYQVPVAVLMPQAGPPPPHPHSPRSRHPRRAGQPPRPAVVRTPVPGQPAARAWSTRATRCRASD